MLHLEFGDNYMDTEKLCLQALRLDMAKMVLRT
jgi:hypothetical protein